MKIKIEMLEEMLRSIGTSPLSEYRMREPLSAHTTFRIGGPAVAWFSPGDEGELAAVLRLCKEHEIPYAILGNGSNLLAGDRGFDGVVISLEKNWSYCRKEKDGRLRAGAGTLLGNAARTAQKERLTGMEFAAGIPGTVGGALVMNAGAYGSEMKQILTEALVMTPEGQVLRLKAEELELGYRTSCIPSKGYIVLEGTFWLQPGDPEAIGLLMRELGARRREKQPLEYPSAGSTFKRPEGYFAGKLIQDAGLSGFSVGGAQVSEKHCGFVINRGGASAADVLALCEHVKKQVKDRFGVELELEIKRLGDF